MKEKTKENKPSLRRLGIFGTLAGGAMLSALIGYGACTTYVRPNEVAVKEARFGEGVQTDHVYEGGRLYFERPGEAYNRFPTDVQVLDYNNYDDEKKLEDVVSGYRKEPSLSVRSSEGHDNTFDVTIKYRIEDPIKLLDKKNGVGKGKLYVEHVKSKVQWSVNEAFGALTSEDVYNTDKRVQASSHAKKLLGDALEPAGIEVLDVLVRRWDYPAGYEKRLSDKALQSQLEETRTRQAEANKYKAIVARIDVEGSKLVEIEKSRASKVADEIKAEGDLYYRERVSEGDLLLKNAEAKGTRLVNKSLDGPGAERIVGLEMAEQTASAIKNVYVQSCSKDGANPLNLKEMGRKLSGGQ